MVRRLNKNLWRYESMLSFEDSYQEAYIKFMELCEKYKGVVSNPRWFMALYKRTLSNLITDFANTANRQRRQVSFSELQVEEEQTPFEELLRGDDCPAELEMLIEAAPEHVRQVLTLLCNTDAKMLGVLAQSWERRGKRKLDGNEFLCRMLGYDPRKVDLVYATQAYFEENEE